MVSHTKFPIFSPDLALHRGIMVLCGGIGGLMRIVEPYAKMLVPLCSSSYDATGNFHERHGIEMLQGVEEFGRVSHRSEDKQTGDSYERFLRAIVLGKGDWSITEHASVTVEAVVDRGITHDWVRHRLGAYTQESTRFVNYDVKDETGEPKHPALFVRPPLEPNPNAKGQYVDLYSQNERRDIVLTSWNKAINDAEVTYAKLLQFGLPPQIARSVFPNALAAKIIVTYNLRMWRHFFLMRTTKEAHPQMREVTVPLLKEFQTKIPILYEDISPDAWQKDNLQKGR